MAQDWAYAFYHSRAWEETRAAYCESVLWLCERCGDPGTICHHRQWLTPETIGDPWVTLGWWNLECVCQCCHNREHFPELSWTREGFAFDAEGNLVELGPPIPES